MGQGQIIVETAELESAALKIENLTSQYHNDYTELYSLVDSLNDLGAWQGADNVAFVNQIKEFKNDFERMEQLMKDYSGFLRKTASGYKTTQGYITSQANKNLKTTV